MYFLSRNHLTVIIGDVCCGNFKKFEDIFLGPFTERLEDLLLVVSFAYTVTHLTPFSAAGDRAVDC